VHALRTKPLFKLIAVLAPLMAVAPIALGLDGAWIAVHLLGGGLSLLVLIYSASMLPNPWRFYAASAAIISIATIAVVTDGGSIAAPVQVAMLIVLGGTYVACVFWRHD